MGQGQPFGGPTGCASCASIPRALWHLGSASSVKPGRGAIVMSCSVLLRCTHTWRANHLIRHYCPRKNEGKKKTMYEQAEKPPKQTIPRTREVTSYLLPGGLCTPYEDIFLSPTATHSETTERGHAILLHCGPPSLRPSLSSPPLPSCSGRPALCPHWPAARRPPTHSQT